MLLAEWLKLWRMALEAFCPSARSRLLAILGDRLDVDSLGFSLEVFSACMEPRFTPPGASYQLHHQVKNTAKASSLSSRHLDASQGPTGI
jgi:hypothetical protein